YFQLFTYDSNFQSILQGLGPQMRKDFFDLLHSVRLIDSYCPEGAGHGRIAYVNENINPPVIVICPEFWDLSPNEQIGTLLHEYMHLLGYSELDSYLIEYLLGYTDRDLPIPNFNSTDPDERRQALRIWCSIKNDGKSPISDFFEDLTSGGKSRIVQEPNGNWVLKGKAYDLNLTNGDLWDKSTINSSSKHPVFNMGGTMPPETW